MGALHACTRIAGAWHATGQPGYTAPDLTATRPIASDSRPTTASPRHASWRMFALFRIARIAKHRAPTLRIEAFVETPLFSQKSAARYKKLAGLFFTGCTPLAHNQRGLRCPCTLQSTHMRPDLLNLLRRASLVTLHYDASPVTCAALPANCIAFVLDVPLLMAGLFLS